jgi:hypothetical protein
MDDRRTPSAADGIYYAIRGPKMAASTIFLVHCPTSRDKTPIPTLSLPLRNKLYAGKKLTHLQTSTMKWGLDVPPKRRQYRPHPHSIKTQEQINIIILNFILLSLVSLLSDWFPVNFFTNILHAILTSPLRSTCPLHQNFLDFTIPTIVDKMYN